MRRSSGKRVVLGLLAALAATLAVGAYLRASVQEATRAVLPTFAEPPAGPRAPGANALGVLVGSSHLPDVQTIARVLRARCGVGGPKAAPRLPGAVDAITTPSWALVPAGPRSPRIVWRCQTDRPLADRARPPVGGELLYAFDSPTHGLRHASFARAHADAAVARQDLVASIASLRERFGAPSTGAEAPAVIAAPVLVEWRFADLVVRASAVPAGDQVVVREEVEVPWPVRAGKTIAR